MSELTPTWRCEKFRVRWYERAHLCVAAKQIDPIQRFVCKVRRHPNVIHNSQFVFVMCHLTKCARNDSVVKQYIYDDFVDLDNDHHSYENQSKYTEVIPPNILWKKWKIFFFFRCGVRRTIAFSFMRFLDHKQRRTTVGRTPLYERSARRRDLYHTTNFPCRLPDSSQQYQQASGRRPTP